MKLILLCSQFFLVSALWASPPPADTIASAIERFVVEHSHQETGTRVTLEIAPLDPKTRVGECDAPEVTLPSGQRLRGRMHVGVHCVSPASWQIFVPVTVKIFGPFLITTRKLTAGQSLEGDAWRIVEGDLSTQPEDVLTSAEQTIGQRMRTGLTAGQPLRRDHLLRLHAVKQGQSVRIIVRGTGFSVSSEGVALANAYEGDTVRARNPAGQIIVGRARSGGIIEVLP